MSQLDLARHPRPIPANHFETRARLAHRAAGQTRLQAARRHQWRNRPMKTPAFNTTVLFYPNKNPKLRLVRAVVFHGADDCLEHPRPHDSRLRAIACRGRRRRRLGDFHAICFWNGWTPRAKTARCAGPEAGRIFSTPCPPRSFPASPARCCFTPTNGSGRLFLPSRFPSAQRCSSARRSARDARSTFSIRQISAWR